MDGFTVTKVYGIAFYGGITSVFQNKKRLRHIA